MPQCAGIKGLFAVGLTTLLVLTPGLAGSVADAASPPALLQFHAFMAPTTQPGKKPCMKAVTLIVEIGESDADAVCSYLPRIRDAVLVELFREPIAIDHRAGMDVRAVETRLLEPLNRVLGHAAVRRVYVIPGTERLAEAEAARLPFSRIIGCRRPRNGKA